MITRRSALIGAAAFAAMAHLPEPSAAATALPLSELQLTFDPNPAERFRFWLFGSIAVNIVGDRKPGQMVLEAENVGPAPITIDIILDGFRFQQLGELRPGRSYKAIVETLPRFAVTGWHQGARPKETHSMVEYLPLRGIH